MKSSTVGKAISQVEITNISAHGIWMLFDQKEYFLSYEAFPWFKDARISDILNIKIEHKSYVFWPSLNVELELESIINPEHYPLRYT
jgi:hypothetical protein